MALILMDETVLLKHQMQTTQNWSGAWQTASKNAEQGRVWFGMRQIFLHL